MDAKYAMRKFLSMAALLAPLCTPAKEPTTVVVFSVADTSIKRLTTQADLSEFNRLWSQRTKQEPLHEIDWPYSLKISSENKSTLWLYHPSGLVTVLSKVVMPIYRLGSSEDFNNLLGINSSSLDLACGDCAP